MGGQERRDRCWGRQPDPGFLCLLLLAAARIILPASASVPGSGTHVRNPACTIFIVLRCIWLEYPDDAIMSNQMHEAVFRLLIEKTTFIEMQYRFQPIHQQERQWFPMYDIAISLRNQQKVIYISNQSGEQQKV